MGQLSFFGSIDVHFAVTKRNHSVFFFFWRFPFFPLRQDFFMGGKLTGHSTRVPNPCAVAREHSHRGGEGDSFGWDSEHQASSWTWLHKLLQCSRPPTRPLLACIRRRVCSALTRQLYKLLQSAGSHQGIVFQVQAKLISALAPLSHAGLLLCWIAPIYFWTFGQISNLFSNLSTVSSSLYLNACMLMEYFEGGSKISSLPPNNTGWIILVPSRSRRWSCRQT